MPGERVSKGSEQRGPRADAPDQARAGFARKHGLAVEQLVERDGFVWATIEAASAPAGELVGEVVCEVVTGLQFAKTMRWDGGRFSRPVRWLVVKLGEQPVQVTLMGVTSEWSLTGIAPPAARCGSDPPPATWRTCAASAWSRTRPSGAS